MGERKVHVGVMLEFPEGVGPGGATDAGIMEGVNLEDLRTREGRRALVEKIAVQLDTLLDQAGVTTS